MVEREVMIINRLGLHARAATKLVQTASRFGCQVWVIKDGKQVNAKSIMGILMLAAKQGTHLQLAAQGEDAEQAVAQLEDLIARRFDEDE